MKRNEKTEEKIVLKRIASGLLRWFPFRRESSMLYIGETDDAVFTYLSSVVGDIRKATSEVELKKIADELDSFAYIFVGTIIERMQNPQMVLHGIRKLLAADGTLFLVMHNRLGIRYFVGEENPYTHRVMDGLDYYPKCGRRNEQNGELYTLAEMRTYLHNVGFQNQHVYSVFPSIEYPQILLEESYETNEGLGNRISTFYESPQTIFLDEKELYNSLAANHLLHQMANGYLFECRKDDGALSDMLQVSNSLEREKENAFSTVLHKTYVEKIAAYPEGEKRYSELMQHEDELGRRGIKVIQGRVQNGIYRMPYIDAPTGQKYLGHLFYADREAFLQEMDHFRDLILQSSEIEKETPEDGAILKKGYVDMVPLNAFFLQGDFYFYDQEFMIPHYPANAIIMRMIKTLYTGNHDMETELPIEDMMERYGLLEQRKRWEDMEWDFLLPLWNEDVLGEYRKSHQTNGAWIKANQERMNIPLSMVPHFHEINAQSIGYRHVILFGAGRYAEHFFEQYGEEYPVCTIVDNNPNRWGQKLCGIKIQSPTVLKEMFRPAEHKIVIAVKDYFSITKQLEDMGISSYAIYNANRIYPRNRRPGIHQFDSNSQNKEEKTNGGKKYHIGYIAGVFDLFHVGHLNLLQRAKELCDYLIVGVVQDEGVKDYKGRYPFIPFDERLRIVASNRFVDEARPIPLDHCDTEDAWRMYRFDVQFSGSDYEHDARWLEKQAFLRAHGADLIFFPYTKSTSSTKIKALIDKRLHEE